MIFFKQACCEKGLEAAIKQSGKLVKNSLRPDRWGVPVVKYFPSKYTYPHIKALLFHQRVVMMQGALSSANNVTNNFKGETLNLRFFNAGITSDNIS